MRHPPNCNHHTYWVRRVVFLATEGDHVAAAQRKIRLEGGRVSGVKRMSDGEISHTGNSEVCNVQRIRRILVGISSLYTSHK
jgi:hypothetical protein